jgi:hypothetical protein
MKDIKAFAGNNQHRRLAAIKMNLRIREAAKSGSGTKVLTVLVKLV